MKKVLVALLVIAITISTATGDAVVLKKGDSPKPQFATVEIFDSIELFSMSVTPMKNGVKLPPILKQEILKIVLIPDLGSDLPSGTVLAPYQKALEELKVVVSEYPQTREELLPLGHALAEISENLRNGLIRREGKWVTIDEEDRSKLMPDPNSSNQTTKEKVSTLTTVEGQEFSDVAVSNRNNQNVTFLHSGGAATLPWTAFDKETQLSLGFDFEKAKLASDAAETAAKLAREVQDERIAATKSRAAGRLEQNFGSILEQLSKKQDLHFESPREVCEYLICRMVIDPLPKDEGSAKIWIKSYFGTPDNSSAADFTRERMTTWTYYSYVRNSDTEKYQEDIHFAFSSENGVYFRVDGPEETAGGGTNAFGVSTKTYKTIESVLGRHVAVFKAE